jgi:hypothetical protein
MKYTPPVTRVAAAAYSLPFGAWFLARFMTITSAINDAARAMDVITQMTIMALRLIWNLS